MTTNKLVHLEHVDFVLLEYGLKLLVAHDLSFVLGILQFVGFNVLPQSLHDLRS